MTTATNSLCKQHSHQWQHAAVVAVVAAVAAVVAVVAAVVAVVAVVVAVAAVAAVAAVVAVVVKESAQDGLLLKIILYASCANEVLTSQNCKV